MFEPVVRGSGTQLNSGQGFAGLNLLWMHNRPHPLQYISTE
ncbi:MAG: hypothetical protein HLUCCA01_10040 [Bacteroidetes bacterium HLUCCA01]|nr:MAG: hypothetical protein HLUCCA01_10040 [Bacteroidetes bacterium HLUCCA01]